MYHILIVGHGFVGKAVDYGFQTSNCETYIVDPKYGSTIEELQGDSFDATFVCVPTPYGENGSIDDSIVQSTVEELLKYDTGVIAIKSTVTPDTIERLPRLSARIVYNPEFLTERRANEDFINPSFHVFGGFEEPCKRLEEIYNKCSQCKPCPSLRMSAMDASFVKYGINCFLATKVLWFNQFKDVVDGWGGNYHHIANAIGSDPRIGFSHIRVPGPDGRRGYGGACFPKDTAAFSNYAEGVFTVLDEVIDANNAYRCAYSLDDREKEQKIKFN